MKKLNAILIDDESSSRNSLRQKIQSHCPDIRIVTDCENGEEGIKAIEEHKPDIVFLDVEMPRMNGFAMLQHLKDRSFELIFTTAYDHYAIQAIRYSALDYLVKPIDVHDLQDAVARAHERKQQDRPDLRIETLLHNLVDEQYHRHRIAIPSQEGLQFVELASIIYLEAESNYTSIHLHPTSRILISKTLKEFEELLPTHLFIRIHHSYIVNMNHVNKYLRGEGGQVVMSNGKPLDVSRRKKEEFIKLMGHK